MTLAFSS